MACLSVILLVSCVAAVGIIYRHHRDQIFMSSERVQLVAPAPQVQQVRTLTSASEEDRLNRMADDHRVYILSSDLEADRDQRRVQVEETTF